MKLKHQQQEIEGALNNKDPKAAQTLQSLFCEWGTQVAVMRLIQEYETIKGLLSN